MGCSGYRIDMGVVDPALPGRFLLGVECDGATYHSAMTARDRDRLRQQVLEDLGWRIHRIWSPDWIIKRGSEIKRLKDALDEARALPSGSEPPPLGEGNSGEVGEESAFERAEAITERAGELLPGTLPYSIHELVYRGPLLWEFHNSECREKQCSLLAELVREEGPIHIELAAKRLAALWGLHHVGPRAMKAFSMVVDRGHQRRLFLKVSSFLWPIEMNEVVVRVPSPNIPGTVREINYIPPEELAAGMILIIGHAVGISPDSLLKETSRLFGFNRLGDKIRETLSQAYERLKSKNKLSEIDGVISLSRDPGN